MVGIRKSFYRKNTVLLQCRYSFKFSTSSMRLSAAPEFSVCTGWRWWYSMGARSCYHPAKCDRCFPPPIAKRQRLPNVRIDVWHRVTTELTLRMSEGSALIMSGLYTVRVCRIHGPQGSYAVSAAKSRPLTEVSWANYMYFAPCKRSLEGWFEGVYRAWEHYWWW